MGLVATLTKLLVTPKPLHLEHIAKNVVQLLFLYLQDGTCFIGLSQWLSE